MPKTATRTKKQNRNRTLTAQEYRVLAEQAEATETAQRKQDRRDRFKRVAGAPPRRWATDQHIKVAEKHNRAVRSEEQPQQQPPTGEQFWEQQRKTMIRTRNRNRRRPWYPAVGSVALGMLGQAVVALFDTASVAPEITAGVIAGLPSVAAVVVASKMENAHHQRVRLAERQLSSGVTPTEGTEPVHRKWYTEIAVGGVACSAIVYWIALAGLSWWVVLVVLVGTLTVSARWWRANPIGPGVARLEPPRPEPEPEPEAEPAAPAAAPEKPRDDFAALWNRYNARGKGKALNSRLTNREDTEFAVSYDAELERGVQTPKSLRVVLPELASGLGIQASKLIVEDDPLERGENMARVTIVTNDPVANIRYYDGPTVTATETEGIIHGTGRFGDGRGELDITMWNEAGMVPTSLIGATRSGKSSAANIATDGAMDTGVLNLIYIDPKGISSAELTDVARIAILGPENAARAPELINAIVEARRVYGIKHRISKFNPTPELPGWMALHDEFSELVNRGYRSEALAWTSLVNTIAALGIWPVAINQAMQESKWGDDQCRQAFASQLIVMRMKTTSDKLIPGLELSPSSLPNRKGIGVYAYDQASRSNVPVQFDYVPEPKDARNHPDAPLTTAAAFKASSAKQPDMMREDYDAIVAVLGRPVNGRWVVGPGGTHQFPGKANKTGVAANTTSSTPPRSGGWGAKVAQAVQAPAGGGLDDNARRVLEVIDGGTTATGDIETALAEKMSRATVHRALDALVGANRIHRVRKGEYGVGPDNA